MVFDWDAQDRLKNEMGEKMSLSFSGFHLNYKLLV